MTHDSLCSWCREPGCTRHVPNHDELCPHGELPPPCFTCDLIRKVRADEREAFEQELRNHTFGSEPDLINQDAVKFLSEYRSSLT